MDLDRLRSTIAAYPSGHPDRVVLVRKLLASTHGQNTADTHGPAWSTDSMPFRALVARAHAHMDHAASEARTPEDRRWHLNAAEEALRQAGMAAQVNPDQMLAARRRLEGMTR